MKEITLIQMQRDLRLTQQAMMVALYRIEKLEEKISPKEQDVK